MPNTIQQGDLILRRVNLRKADYPGYTCLQHNRKVTLAQGETSGHAHVIQVNDEQEEAELVSIGNTILLNLEKSAILTHEEHKPVEVPAGTYEVGQAREYDYAAHAERQVMD